MPKLHIDIETYSEINLKYGVYAYAADPSFCILILAYSYGGPVVYLDLDNGDVLPQELLADILDPSVAKVAHNAAFERVCLSSHIYGYDAYNYIHPRNWHCTAVKAAMAGLPHSLGEAAKALGAAPKDKRGGELIRYFSIPQETSCLVGQVQIIAASDALYYAPLGTNTQTNRHRKASNPLEWQAYCDYCVQDVVAEMSIDAALDADGYQVPDADQADYELDQLITDRGICIDMDLVDAALVLDKDSKNRYAQRLKAITGQRDAKSLPQLTRWLASTGIEHDDWTIEGMTHLINSGLDDAQAEALRNRMCLQKTSNAKYGTLKAATCPDGRMRGLTQFYGANRTGRWAGRIVQLHNLPRTYLKDLATGIQVVKAKDALFAESLYDNTQDLLSGLIRTAFVGDLIVADYSAIEARVLAWLAGEHWRMDIFRTHGKIYEASAAAMFGMPIESITKDSEERQKGKVAELALGYQGGPNALITMGALDMGLAEKDLQTIVYAWRDSNPAITALWRTCQNAAIKAIRGTPVSISTRHKMPMGLRDVTITFVRRGKDLNIVLPSGRRLVYRSVWLTKDLQFNSDKMCFLGVNQDTKRFGPTDTYGGKLVENIVQAVARDLLAYSLRVLEAEGYATIGHVHDEAIVDRRPGQTLSRMVGLMELTPPWAEGFPLKAAGYESPFFKK